MLGDQVQSSQLQDTKWISCIVYQNFKYLITKTGIPACERVVTVNGNTKNANMFHEEVLFRMQGALTDINLRPLKL